MKTDCVEFQGCRTKKGYGQKWHNGKLHYTHRLAYCEAHGLNIEEIAGKVVMHSCDNPPCMNPYHLVLGTILTNNQDMSRKRRNDRPHWRVLDAQQVQFIRDYCVPGDSEFGYRPLARKLGCSMGTVQKVARGTTYRRSE